MSAAFTVRALRPADLPRVVQLADRLIGRGYWTVDHLSEALDAATVGDVVCCHLAEGADGTLLGFRLAQPPGAWSSGRGEALASERWPFPLERAGYFQSAWVAPSARGLGVGAAMALAAIADLRALGAAGVVTHSWKESPQGSSRRYLERLGFFAVAEHPDYWIDVDYTCSRDGRPCRCTAIEMVLPLDSEAP